MAVFVDTNVLVYTRDAAEAAKRARAAEWLVRLAEGSRIRLSFQVLHEYFDTVTRKLQPGLPLDAARADVRELLLWEPLELDARTVLGAWAVQDRFGLSFWDSMIVAAAKLQSCTHLLTEDLSDGVNLDGVVVVNPFTTEPAALT